MVAHRSTRFLFLLLAAALFALHFQLMPRVSHASDHQTVSATTLVHFHKGDCDSECCPGTASCIQAALSPAAVLSSPPSARFGVATQPALALLALKPLQPPPKRQSPKLH